MRRSSSELRTVRIYIDESGNFLTREDGSSVGAVGALVVTESQVDLFERRYAQLRPLLPKENGEVKGRNLGEADIARVVDVARRSGLLYEVSVVDLLPDHTAVVEAHRAGQCEGLTAKLTPKHHPNTVAWVKSLRQRLQQMPPQLYAQCVATFDVIWTTLVHATSYYCQREPEALASFRWVVDAKAPVGITKWEDWWSKVVNPMLQSRSMREPFPMLEDGDYSHFAAKDMPVPGYLVEEVADLDGKTGLSMGPVLREVEFTAAPLPGLEVVDVLTNAVRRALVGHLQPRGWRGIAGVMIHRRGGTYVHIATFGPSRDVAEPAMTVLRGLGTGGRSMLTG